MTQAQVRFITYVRTKQFWQLRFRGNNDINPVHIPMAEIKKQFLTNPSKELRMLVNAGLLEISLKETSAGHKMNLYKAIKPGKIDPSMLKPQAKTLDPLTAHMKGILQTVSLKPNSPSTLYFDTFLMLKNKYIDLFFRVDNFCGRVHTPITNFHRPYRPNILLSGQDTASLDVATMQPLLLGKILKSKIGENEYSSWINKGQDIYLIIQKKTNLATRDEAKKRFLQILFSPPNNKFTTMFGNANWIEWINKFKNEPFAPNPHTREKNYSNLAWLLQSTEVKMMRKVWQELSRQDIPFLSVHDEIIVKSVDQAQVSHIFHGVLQTEFDYFRLVTKS